MEDIFEVLSEDLNINWNISPNFCGIWENLNFDTESLSDAYDQSDESGLTPTWINTEKALAQKPTKTVIFHFNCIQLIASSINPKK